MLSKSIMAEVEQQKKAVLSSDATMDSRFSGAHSIIMQGIRSTMCVPLLHGDELLGIMHLDSQIATNAFTEKDLQIFTGIAAQAAIAIQNARLAKKIENETQTRAQFQRLLSPNLVEQLVAGKLHLEKGGELREVTMLISDIRGFTSMSEKKEPAEIVHMLNEYFEVMVDILFRAQGTLDKYVGDEIMALFGAPVDMPDAPLTAVRCAIEMQKALREFNRTRVAEGQDADQDRHRHQHRARHHRRHRLVAHAAVHGHRRRGEHGLAPVLDRQAGRDHLVGDDHAARGRARRRGDAAAGAAQGQGAGAADLQRRRHEGRRVAPRA